MEILLTLGFILVVALVVGALLSGKGGTVAAGGLGVVLAPLMGILGVLLRILVMIIPFKFAWNYVVPSVFHGPNLDWGQAAAVIIVAGVLMPSSSATVKD